MTIRFNDRDGDIFEMFRHRDVITATDVAEKYDRDLSSTQESLRKRADAGVLCRERVYDLDGEYAYFLPERGATVAKRRFGKEGLRVTRFRRKNLKHDLILGRIVAAHIEKAQEAGFKPPFVEHRRSFVQHSFKMPDKDGKEVKRAVVPDVFLGFEQITSTIRAFFQCELELSLGGYEEGESDRDRKVKAYNFHRDQRLAEEFWKPRGLSVKDYKVPFWFETEKKRNDWLQDMHWEHPSKVYWAATIADVVRDPFGEVYITPAEYDSANPEASPRTGIKKLFQLQRH